MSTPTITPSTATLYKLSEPEKGPPDSIEHSSVYQAMYTPHEGEFESGTAMYNPVRRGFKFTRDDSTPVSELVYRANTLAMVPTTEGSIFLFGKPLTLAEDADWSHESRASGQPPTSCACDQDSETGENQMPNLVWSDEDEDSDEAEEVI